MGGGLGGGGAAKGWFVVFILGDLCGVGVGVALSVTFLEVGTGTPYEGANVSPSEFGADIYWLVR